MTQNPEDRYHRSIPELQPYSIWLPCNSQSEENSHIIMSKTVTKSTGKIKLQPAFSSLYLGSGHGSTLEQGSGWNPKGKFKWAMALLSEHIFMTFNDICTTVCLRLKPRSLCKPSLLNWEIGESKLLSKKCSGNIGGRTSTAVADHGSALETQRRGINQVVKVLQRDWRSG